MSNEDEACDGCGEVPKVFETCEHCDFIACEACIEECTNCGERNDLGTAAKKRKTPTKTKKWKPKTDHTDAEKIAAFDAMHKFAMSYVKALKKNERFKDASHYAYETLIENTVAHEENGSDFWEFRNNLDYDWED